MTRVVVLGGSGFVGRAFARRCAAQSLGVEVTVVTRALSRGAPLRLLPGVNLLEADVQQSEALQRAVTGADTVLNLVAILHGMAEDFRRVHVDLPRAVAQACRHAGVRHLVHVSALGCAAEAPSDYLRSKAAGEQALREAGLPVTVLRPSVMFGEEDQFLNLFARMQTLLPLVPLAGASARIQPVWVRDVAQALRVCVERGPAGAGLYEAAGPQVFTLAELVRLAGRHAGHVRPVLSLPPPLARLQAWMLEHAPGPTLMSRDNLRSLEVDNVASGTTPGLPQLGITPASIEQAWAVEAADATTQSELLRWRAARGR